MTDDTADLDYDALVQQALRGVVRKILDQVALHGLPGEHHFYIAFRTRHEGVVLPDHLRQRYPDEMTIVLQHKYWDLLIEDEYFQVKLSFNQKAELIRIPYAAIVGFVDPSVQFALQFQDMEGEEETPVPVSDETVEEAGHGQADAAHQTEPTGPNEESAEGKVVTLDAFRKKN